MKNKKRYIVSISFKDPQRDNASIYFVLERAVSTQEAIDIAINRFKKVIQLPENVIINRIAEEVSNDFKNEELKNAISEIAKRLQLEFEILD